MDIAFIIVVVLLLICWLIGDIRREEKIDRLCQQVSALSDTNDENILEYSQYVVLALKNNQKVLTFSAWRNSLQ